MENKVVIFGSRSIKNISKSKIDDYLFFLLRNCELKDTTIISGCAAGVDSIAIRYAELSEFKIEKYPADWSIGKTAGFIRNQKMAEIATHGLCFWDSESKGTLDMIRRMKKLRKPILVDV